MKAVLDMDELQDFSMNAVRIASLTSNRHGREDSFGHHYDVTVLYLV